MEFSATLDGRVHGHTPCMNSDILHVILLSTQINWNIRFNAVGLIDLLYVL